MPDIYVIIPAAGFGERMNLPVAKQFLKVGTKTILEHSADIFLLWKMVKKIIIPLSDLSLSPLTHPKIKYCLGGETRFDSVKEAVKLISTKAKKDDWVIVHDAARPFLQTSEVIRCFLEIKNDAIGGVVASPIASTVKQVGCHKVIEKTLNRDHLVQAETPQIFRYQHLQRALNETGSWCTDESMALEEIGLKPRVILTKQVNCKVTTQADVAFFKFFLSEREKND